MPATKPPRVRFLSASWWASQTFRMAQKVCIAGILVGLPGKESAEGQQIRAKLTEALTLLERCDPRRFAYLKRDVPRILIYGRPNYRGMWFNAVAICELQWEYVQRSDVTPAEIAATLAHEAMHARLHRWGFGYEEKERARIEYVCIKAERAFALRLPDSLEPARSHIIHQAERKLAQNPVIWTNESKLESDLSAMRELGAPKWLISFLRWGTNRRKRAAKL